MRVVLTGASGQLGAYLLDRLVDDGVEVVAWTGTSSGERSGVRFVAVDLADADATALALARSDPDAIVHLAAVSTAEAARLDPARARIVNVEATGRLADWCTRLDRRFLFTSTDLVFDGESGWRREDDPARPILEYGRTKLRAERAALVAPRALVARLPLLFGPSRSGRESFFDRAMADIQLGRPRAFFDDEHRTPLSLDTAAALLARLLAADATGLLHAAGAERVSRFALMRRAASALRLDPTLVRANRRADAPGPEPRPADVSLDTSRLAALLPGLHRPSIEQAIETGGPIRE